MKDRGDQYDRLITVARSGQDTVNYTYDAQGRLLRRAQAAAGNEHVFGTQLMRAGTLIVRTIGIVRARCKIGLRNQAYNIDRYAMLKARHG